MLRCYSTIRVLIGTLMMLSLPHLVMAQSDLSGHPGNIHFGDLKVHPYLNVQEEFTDNYFLTHRSRKNEWYTTIIPGINLQLPFKRHKLILDYHSEIERHNEYTRFDGTFHDASGLLELKFGRRLGLNIEYQYTKSRTLPDSEDDTVDDYHYYQGKVEALYQLTNRYKLTVAYLNNIKYFQDHENREDDFTMNEIPVTLHYRFLAKTHLLLEYAFSQIDNKDLGDVDTDNDNHRIWVGLEWDPDAKITGRIAGGYITRRYEHEEGGDDEDTFGMEGDLSYLFSKLLTFRLKLERQIIQSEATSDQAIYGVHYTHTGGMLSLIYKIPFLTTGLLKSSTSIGGFYYNDDYTRRGILIEKRDDDRYGGNVGLSFKYRGRIGFTLNYVYTDNDSNIPVETYRENRVFFQFSIML